jgi:Ion channel
MSTAVCRSLTTLSTVGFGDITPKHHHFVFALFFLFSVVLFAYVLGMVVSTVVDLRKFRKLEKFFKKGLTYEMLEQLDSIDGDGSVRDIVTFASCSWHLRSCAHTRL